APRLRHVAHVWVPMSDGVRLSASLWLPPDADQKPCPAVLEIIPYRKRDHTAMRDWGIHGFLAEHGFAGIRVDMRGTGDSEGLDDAHRTYADTVEVLAWLRAQPWCDGHLGMIGLSWGGINALLAAERKPSGLKAVVATAFSYDRFSIGMGRKNGCILNENLAWAAACTGFTSRPPDPAVVGEAWRGMWLERLRNMTEYAPANLGRQRRDEAWDKHRLRDPKAIDAAFCMFSGQADSNYAQTLPYLMEHMRAPRRATLGPWCHKYPHQAQPGPAIDFLGEAVEFLDHHLRGGPAPKDRPGFIAFLSEDVPAREFHPAAPGRWVGLESWPPHAPQVQSWHLAQGRLQESAPEPAALSHLSPQTVGLASGEIMPWFAYAPGAELPGDQRADDGGSLCFDTAPLAEDLDTLGAPELEIDIEVDRPTAFLVSRLCDVKPDGTSVRVNLGIHNLAHLEDSRSPKALEPGRRHRVRLKLDVKGYRFKAGHRIRLALSTSYWPIVWPTPEPVTLTVHLGASRLHLPLLTGAVTPEGWAPFGPPRTGPLPARTEVAPVRRARRIETDVAARETVLTIEEENGAYRLDDIDWTVASSSRETYRISPDDPLRARVEIAIRWRFSRGDWSVSTAVDATLTHDREALHCRMRLTAQEGETPVFESDKSWSFPRNHL
ncbi:MAG TPA: CocE/NonD family hydrolase, partial [Acetobacteraceae bacterium]|nr:CocE/NonD family hydrolase [Acetobacteraceae bacterium]